MHPSVCQSVSLSLSLSLVGFAIDATYDIEPKLHRENQCSQTDEKMAAKFLRVVMMITSVILNLSFVKKSPFSLFPHNF